MKRDLVPIDDDHFNPREDGVACVSRWIAQILMIGLVVLMCLEMLVRSLLGWSIQFSNEFGGYALVAIAFLALGSGQLTHSYHRVQFLEERLGARGQATLKLVFDLLALIVVAVLLFLLVRFEWITWKSGDVAATSLMTPLWIPRLAMPVGMLGLLWALLRTVASDLRRCLASR